MSRIKAIGDTGGAIWSRMLQPENPILSREAARSLLRLDFTAEDKQRMHELAVRAREGSLTSREMDEITTYERVGNLLALVKSRARLRLKKPSGSKNGTVH